LAASLEPAVAAHTTVVFDAKAAPPGLPRTVSHHGITVRYAAQYETADELIIELIEADHGPRQLVVVSSDHQIQRAARRRKAESVDSDVWYAEVIRLRRERVVALAEKPVRPPVPLLEEDVNYWIRQFGGEKALADFIEAEVLAMAKPAGRRPVKKAPTLPPPAPEKRPSPPDVPKSPENQEKRPKKRARPRKPDEDLPKTLKEDPRTLDNPFPPGYGEDLLEDF
jgi:uncharacterized protein